MTEREKLIEKAKVEISKFPIYTKFSESARKKLIQIDAEQMADFAIEYSTGKEREAFEAGQNSVIDSINLMQRR